MKLSARTLCCFLCLCLVCPLLFSCTRDHGPDEDPVDSSLLLRPTSITLLTDKGELPGATYEVCLKDSYDLPVAGAEITLAGHGVTKQTAVTDEEGVARFVPKCAAGTHQVNFSFAGDSFYRECLLPAEIVALERINRSGVYVRAAALDTLDFEELKEAGAGHIFLHQEVLSQISREGIEEFLAEAKKHKISVHLWLICLWDKGAFVSPIDRETKDYAQDYFDTEAEKVRRAAELEGLAGLHFDYIRFDGEETRADLFRATKGGGGEVAVTEFVRQMTSAAKSVNSSLVFSGTVMAQYADLVPMYGQDLTTLSEYFDFFVPMLYAGNYDKDVHWVTECMRMLRQEFPELDFRPAVLSYESDTNQTNRSVSDVDADVAALYEAGADGVTLFHYRKNQSTLTDLEPA